MAWRKSWLGQKGRCRGYGLMTLEEDWSLPNRWYWLWMGWDVELVSVAGSWNCSYLNTPHAHLFPGKCLYMGTKTSNVQAIFGLRHWCAITPSTASPIWGACCSPLERLHCHHVIVKLLVYLWGEALQWYSSNISYSSRFLGSLEALALTGSPHQQGIEVWLIWNQRF